MDKKPQDSESRHADKYILRFPDGMRDRIATAAKENGRSMNSEIIARLQHSFKATSLYESIGVIALEHSTAKQAEDEITTVVALANTIARLESKLVETEAAAATARLYRTELAAYLTQALQLMPVDLLTSIPPEELLAMQQAAHFGNPEDENYLATLKKAADEAEEAVKKLKSLKGKRASP
ncbi:Arc family DNA-binding protein [Herbaspirillum huttiense]|uniref:Arc family DNA-binding protein n=1 Tax=Herbaspirillum huttiense TaxID=863372 RepID=UPI003CD08E24